MTKVLLIDDDGDYAEKLGRGLAQRGLTVIRASDNGEAIAQLRNRTIIWDLVVLCMAGRSGPWRSALHELQQAGRQVGFREVPVFLCVSRLHLGVDVQLQIERMGARYACEE